MTDPAREAVPEGYLGGSARITRGPAPELVEAGYALETADAPLLHRGLTLADLAHVLVLVEADVVPAGTVAPLVRALLEVLDTDAADFPYDPLWGDAYNSRERELERRLGATAGWLHTGRTRREAGRIAFRLALLDLLADAHEAAIDLVEALVSRAEEHAGTVWNDSTYLQPAQPSTFGHYLLGVAEEGLRDLDRLEVAVRWADRSPAGVGGVGGTLVPLDRDRLARLFGFAEVGAHTRDVMWSVDGMADAVVAAAQLATTVDRLAEDLEIWTSPQFAWVELDASLCRASVQMPQKRNPYALAVIRGGANTLLGRAAGALATGRTPSARTDNWLHAYGETAGAVVLARRLAALGRVTVATLQVDSERLARSAGEQFTCATDVTELLVLDGGLDYRTAYRIVGAAVAAAATAGRTRFADADLDGVAAQAAAKGGVVPVDRLRTAADPGRALEGRTCVGGSAPARVLERCLQLDDELRGWRERVTGRRAHRRDALARLVADASVLANAHPS